MIMRLRATKLLALIVALLATLTLGLSQASVAHAALVFVPGTGNPHDAGIPPHHGKIRFVPYPASPPVVSDYPGSVQAGTSSLQHTAITTHNVTEIGGYSQGAQVVRIWAARHPRAASRYTIVTVGDPCTEKTGIIRRWPTARAATVVGCPQVPAGVQMIVINRADDPIANFPARLDNGVAIANALAGYDLDHSSYRHINVNAPGVRHHTVGNVTYITLPAHKTPALERLLVSRGIHLNRQDRGTVRSLVSAPTAQPAPSPRRDAVASVPAPPAVVAPVQAAPVSAPVQIPTSIDAAASQVAAVAPPEAAPVVNNIAQAVKQSPVGPVIQQLLGGRR